VRGDSANTACGCCSGCCTCRCCSTSLVDSWMLVFIHSQVSLHPELSRSYAIGPLTTMSLASSVIVSSLNIHSCVLYDGTCMISVLMPTLRMPRVTLAANTEALRCACAQPALLICSSLQLPAAASFDFSLTAPCPPTTCCPTPRFVRVGPVPIEIVGEGSARREHKPYCTLLHAS
jgi:hypothetical protein